LSDYATHYALRLAERRAIPIREKPAKTASRRIYSPKKVKLDFAAARPVPELPAASTSSLTSEFGCEDA
jgi:hypothetical protein